MRLKVWRIVKLSIVAVLILVLTLAAAKSDEFLDLLVAKVRPLALRSR